MDIQWVDCHHRALNVQQLHRLLALRNQVFIVEQNCPYLDIDGQDLARDNRHILGELEGKLLAYARVLTPADDAAPVMIGRVIVSQEARGLQLGYRLMEKALESCEQHWPQHAIYLSAQAHLEGFYGRLGFSAVGEVYLEDNIPHIGMQRG
ncbi:GNAT family N-acetyltransferase [Pantoea sp. Mb-10]|uniref:GNAT family N-acetyltransferase n=1 Tax=unclassified Pantoea TaxID=2630326 RepID=UPI001E28895B|nr:MULTISPECIES: GNAT family N-acetyltransferase [unclassified Pantoea]MCE0489366.1 GNAT family N-acetyltransferase [Pantoea sp. Mb-10]MCE0501894.1 GNAT family N-acetyltransferase [Pantoea sp. Pb-8]